MQISRFFAGVSNVFSRLEGSQGAAQEAVARPELFSPLQIGLLAGVTVLFLLLVLCAVSIRSYRKRLLSFENKCEELEPQLENTRHELSVKEQQLAFHERMIDGAGAAVFQLDEKGECVYVNPAMGALSGFSKYKLSKQNPSVNDLLNTVHPDDRENVRGEWSGFASRPTPCESSYRLKQKNGSIVHVTERGSVLRDDKRHITGYLGLLMDVSDQARDCSEARIAEQRSNWFIQEASSGFFKLSFDEPVPLNLPAEEMAERIYRRAKLSDCDSDLAAFHGQSVEELTGTALEDLSAGCGFFENPDEVRRFVDNGFRISGEEGVRTDCRGNPVCLRFDVAGLMEDEKLVSIWGTQHDISRQKREQEELQHREEFYRRILDSLPGDVFVKDPRCRYLYVSHGFEERTGIPVDDWVDKTVFEILPAAPRNINKTSIQAMKTGTLSRTVDVRTDSGRQAWIETLENPLISSEGVVEGVVGISMDVTDRAVREQELQKAEARFHHLMDHNPVAIMMADASSRMLTYANPAFCDLFGYTAEEIPCLKVDDLHSPGSRRQVLAEWNERARHAQRFEEALPCLRKDRSIVFADVVVSGGFVDGSDHVVAVYSDAAGRKQIENELERQRDLQAGLLRNASVLVVTVDPSGTIRFVNDELLELLGKDESEFVGKPCADTLVCEEDREQLTHAFEENTPGFQADVEIRLPAADGTLYTAACRIRTWVDPSGKADGFTIAGVNVTPLRMLEQQLREECGGLRNRLEECEDKLTETAEAYNESERLRKALAGNLKQLEETLTSRKKQFEKTLVESDQREAELTGVIEELETRKAGLEETQEARRVKLEQESQQRKQLDEQLHKTQEEFSAERERFELDARQKIESLEENLQQLRIREEGLVEESSLLNSRLSSAEEALQTRTAELETRSVEWEAETERLIDLRRRLEEKAAEQAKQLKQATADRAGLDCELKASRKEAESGRKDVQVQVKQSTVLLKKELKELTAREKPLKAVQEKTTRRLKELETVLSERSLELKAVVAARKEDERLFRKTRQELKKQLQQDKADIARLREQTERDQADRCIAEERWKKDRAALLAKTQELGTALSARTHELTFSVVARREEEQSFRKELQELEDQVRQEKEKQTRLHDRANEDTADRSREGVAWEQEREVLQAQMLKLEEVAEDRTKRLEQAAEERTGLEARLAETREDSARRLETVDEQIEQKTEDLKQQLKIQCEREEKLKTEQQVLAGRLTEMQEDLNERSEEVAGLLKTKQGLEELLALEKENLAQRILLSKEEMDESRKSEQVCQQREEELLGEIRKVDEQLEQRTHDVTHETGERERAERDIARLKKAAEAGHRMVLNLTEDLNGPLVPVLELSEAALQETDQPEEVHARLTEINQCARRLQTILSYRRELVRLEDGTVRAEPEWFDLNEFLTGLTGEFTEQSEAKQLFFASSCKGDLSGRFRADLAKVRLVLSTLFNHTLAKTSAGQVGLHTICESFGDGRKKIAFLLMYSGLDQDSAATGVLLNSTGADKSCGDMSGEELQLDLIRRQAQMLGGEFHLENPSERRQVLSFVLPVEYEPASDSVTDAPATVEAHAV